MDDELITKKLNELHKIPKFENQMKFVENLELNKENKILYLKKLDSIFDEIPTNRKDKFYFLLKKIIETIDFEYFYSINNLDVRNYFLREYISYGYPIEDVSRLEAFVNKKGYFSTKKILLEINKK